MTGDPTLSNPDLIPTTAAQRTWRWYHFAALWVGMVMCIPAYTLAASLIESGMSWSQAVGTVFLGNLIVLLPMLLIGHAGAKYGIPYAVLARASFGTQGARLPALLRALVACGWYGIQTWFGGQMIYTLAGVLMGHPLSGDPLPGLGISAAQLACFLLFWLLQFWFVVHGIDAIRKLETYTAPIKILICFVLLGWAWDKAGGFGPILDQPSAFVEGGKKAGQFSAVFWPSLTAMVGFWATLALNIPDFTRFAHSQRDQFVGQAIGLPAPMGLLAALAVFVTSATVVIYGKALWDPVDLASRMTGAAVLIALIVLLVDTVSVNLAANLVGPAYDFSALAPGKVSYKLGGMLTAGIAIVMMPWKILASTQGYVFTWLIGYSALLGPVAGILIVDYYVVRKTELIVGQLYVSDGYYSYRGGWNMAAVVAFLIGVAPNVPGFLNAAFPAAFPEVGAAFKTIYTYAWFVGLLLAGASYVLLTIAAVMRTPSTFLESADRQHLP
ncbi:NCS1 family nucleobase:cation symporter-1 [Roseateles saccharophilus]|uniref:NCS1 family nucleobase:cation symporter-1 n=1 Tax=Roseateles saccharophilus TaxID=304 RepID=A0A4R3UI19_ROSSA|nr:NCS1 family nucleobase:cation symporter-1 [Roseateles saccharophilus]MDG0835077.1 nitrate reductase [Roseateles saccharophilus]TCU88255.1 NCS1 family nucleobase:cation symporter-1 [Roseateles saccharophilus]